MRPPVGAKTLDPNSLIYRRCGASNFPLELCYKNDRGLAPTANCSTISEKSSKGEYPIEGTGVAETWSLKQVKDEWTRWQVTISGEVYLCSETGPRSWVCKDTPDGEVSWSAWMNEYEWRTWEILFHEKSRTHAHDKMR